MKNILSYIGLLGICLLSFYYTEKLALYAKSKNPIYETLEKLEEEKYVSSINASIIDGYFIIPGINGKELNIDASFKQIKDEIVDDLLVFDEIKPKLSLENNKDKIIIRGNSKKNSISLIFGEDNKLINYMIDNKYNIDILLNNEKYNNKVEMINNSKIESTYKTIEKYLTKNKLNKNICIVNEQISNKCNNKYLVKISLNLNYSNFSQNIKRINSGEIIYIEHTLTLEQLNLLLDQIKYQNLNIVYLSNLISES